MTRNRLYWVFGAVILLAFGVWQFGRGEPSPLTSGKPVAYWLDHLPFMGLPEPLLRDDNPLALAGPEIIPSLIHEIKNRSTIMDFINRYRWRFPRFLQNRLPKEGPPGYFIRVVAAFRLGMFGPVASNAVPCLVELLRKPATYSGDRGRIIQALGFIGPNATKATPLLVESLSDPSEWIRMTAAYSLLQIGVVPPEAAPALKRNLRDTGYVAASMAVGILVAEPSVEARARIESMLTKNLDGNTRAHVAAALGLLRQIPDEVTPILRRMLEEDSPSLRQGAAIGLARPHTENLKRIVAVLVEGLKEGQFQIRCADALGRIGPEASDAIADLENAKGYVLRNAAAQARARILKE